MSHIWRFSHRWGGELVHRLARAAARASQCRTSQCHRNPVVPRYATLCHPVVPCFRRFGGWRNQHGVAATSLRLSRLPRVFAQDTRCSWNRMESHLMICKQGYKRKQHQWIIFQNACTEAQWKDLANSSGHESLLVSCPVSIRKWYAAGWDSVCQF